jgi:hypothetical protein
LVSSAAGSTSGGRLIAHTPHGVGAVTLLTLLVPLLFPAGSRAGQLTVGKGQALGWHTRRSAVTWSVPRAAR